MRSSPTSSTANRATASTNCGTGSTRSSPTRPTSRTCPRHSASRLDAELPLALTPVTEQVSDRGDTVKFLWELDGGSRVETVLMLYTDRATVCVSSQAGCAMGCGFCATGQAGFTRHLTVGEIVEQVVRAAQRARQLERRVSNIVFMGMGEPMANLEPVWQSIERFHGDLGLSARHITISTVGIIPGIRSLEGPILPVNLAVSLHAANDTLRDELVPINRRYPIEELMEACDDYLQVKHRRVSFEWAMIEGVNDRDSDARELAALCRRLSPHGSRQPHSAQSDARLPHDRFDRRGGSTSSATCSNNWAPTPPFAAIAAPTSTPPAANSPPANPSSSPGDQLLRASDTRGTSR